MKLAISILIILSFFVLSCQKQQDTYADDYEQAQVLMEEGKYNSVITLLEPSLSKNPKDQPMRLLLASAYAARAGVFISSFSALAKGFLSSPAAPIEWDTSKDTALSGSIEQIRNYLDSFQKSIPHINTDKQWMDIERAISLIEQNSDHSGGAAAYSGLLRLVSFRYQLYAQQDFFTLRECQITAKILSSKINFIFNNTSAILGSFMRATPKQNEKQELQAHIRNLINNQQLLNSWISQAETLDEFKITKIFQKCAP